MYHMSHTQYLCTWVVLFSLCYTGGMLHFLNSNKNIKYYLVQVHLHLIQLHFLG